MSGSGVFGVSGGESGMVMSDDVRCIFIEDAVLWWRLERFVKVKDLSKSSVSKQVDDLNKVMSSEQYLLDEREIEQEAGEKFDRWLGREIDLARSSVLSRFFKSFVTHSVTTFDVKSAFVSSAINFYKEPENCIESFGPERGQAIFSQVFDNWLLGVLEGDILVPSSMLSGFVVGSSDMPSDW